MSIAKTALDAARVHLNDIGARTWSDAILMPMLQRAHVEMVQELDVNSIGVIKAVTSPITVVAGVLNLGTNQPSNILEPISMMERDPGTDAESFVDMYKVNFLPEIDQSQYLTWWAWLGEVIQFIGATMNREVILRYKGSLSTPNILTDPIGVIYGENYIGPRVAALAYDSIGKDSTKIDAVAQKNLYRLIQRNVLSDQTPVRRKGYRSPKSTLGVTGQVSLSIGAVAPSPTFAASTTQPNGVITTYSFLYNPTAIFVGGVIQPQSSYSVSPVGMLFNITFTSGSYFNIPIGNGISLVELYSA